VVRFGLAGDGELVGNLGTPDGSRVVELANGHARITVLTEGGVSTVSVSSKGLRTAFLAIA
jgi:beta-galactosidase